MLTRSSELLLASLTKPEADMVDWEGQYQPYSGTMMQHKLTKQVSTQMRPKPAPLPPEHPTYAVAQAAFERSKQIMRPLVKEEAIHALTELRLHTIDANLPEKAAKLKISNIIDDLAGYPHMLVKETLKKWRNRPDSPLYFPTSGQLKQEMHARHVVLKKCHKRIAVLCGVELESEVNERTVNAHMRDLLTSVLETIKV